MKIFNKTGIFADTTEPTQSAPDAPEAVETSEHVSELERAQNALKKANKAIQAGKAQEDASEPNAYEQYVTLQLSDPTAAGIFWRANKQAIYACIPSK